MVAIARGMMADPKLLVFDEPSLGLSPLLVQQMFDIIRDVTAHGVTVLLVEQNVFRTLRLADRGYVLENGAIVRAGTGAELLGDPMSRRPIWATEYHAKETRAMSLRCAYIDHGKGGPPDILRLAEREMEAAGRQVLIEVAYAGVNRPDVLQRSGSYPPPPGASPHLGLEVSGTVIATGPQASRWRVGDRSAR